MFLTSECIIGDYFLKYFFDETRPFIFEKAVNHILSVNIQTEQKGLGGAGKS
jgi:hypothetical protein